MLKPRRATRFDHPCKDCGIAITQGVYCEACRKLRDRRQWTPPPDGPQLKQFTGVPTRPEWLADAVKWEPDALFHERLNATACRDADRAKTEAFSAEQKRRRKGSKGQPIAIAPRDPAATRLGLNQWGFEVKSGR